MCRCNILRIHEFAVKIYTPCRTMSKNDMEFFMDQSTFHPLRRPTHIYMGGLSMLMLCTCRDTLTDQFKANSVVCTVSDPSKQIPLFL